VGYIRFDCPRWRQNFKVKGETMKGKVIPADYFQFESQLSRLRRPKVANDRERLHFLRARAALRKIVKMIAWEGCETLLCESDVDALVELILKERF
jgi:hypothetical protein